MDSSSLQAAFALAPVPTAHVLTAENAYLNALRTRGSPLLKNLDFGSWRAVQAIRFSWRFHLTDVRISSSTCSLSAIPDGKNPRKSKLGKYEKNLYALYCG